LKQRFGAARQPAVTTAAQPPQPPPIVDVGDAGFAGVVLQAPQLAVVDFWAEWCQPCQVMSAYVGFLAKDYAGRVLVAALDTDENPETPARYQVMGLPTLLFLQGGEEVDRIVGVAGYEEIKTRVDRLLGNQ
jgi:thioredoxin 1